MGDLISRQAVNELVDELARAISDEKSHIQRGRNYGRIMHDILELPSVEPERKTGMWIKRRYIHSDKIIDMKICSECGYEFSYDAETGASIYDYDYCPNCGNYKRNKAEGDIE